MTDGEQQLLNMMMQLNNTMRTVAILLKNIKEKGIPVVTQESHRP
jgi:hypothetical protein